MAKDTSIRWKETVSRGTAVVLMNNFRSVAEAIAELVDNAVDFRWGQKLVIEVTHDKKRAVIESRGGRGMGAEEIQAWLNWGAGEVHESTHIGHWHQGGKAACGFLGEHVKLWAKRQGSDDIWFLEDKGWGVRSDPKDFGSPSPIAKSKVPESMASTPTDEGHVKIELAKLNKDRRWRLDQLRKEVATTYRNLLRSGEVVIRINGEDVPALDIPLSTASTTVNLNVKLPGGRKARGWASRMKRDQLKWAVKGGIHLIYNGRLIQQGEWFGYNHEGKGALNSLIGELHMDGFTPLPMKNDFVERSDSTWDGLSMQVLSQLQPLIAELRRSGDDVKVSKQAKARASKVADQLERVFKSMNEQPEHSPGTNGSKPQTQAGPGGRKKPTPRAQQAASPVQPRGPNGNPPKPKTAPPKQAVGSIARLLQKITGGSTRPPIRVGSWDTSERSTWTTDGGRTFLDINANYHLYKSFAGSEPYIAETAILQLAAPSEGEAMPATEYLEKVNLMLLKWGEVAAGQGQPAP